MARRIVVFLLQLLLIFVLLIVPMSSGNVNEGFKDNMDPIHLLHKDGIYSRKLWRLDATMQDYDEGGANQKHDPSYPPKRRPGHP